MGSNYQYEEPRVPSWWGEEERRFALRVIAALDDLYSRQRDSYLEKTLSGLDIRSNSYIRMMVNQTIVWRVEIASSNPNILTDGSSTMLSARVYEGAVERTDDYTAPCFRWRREGDDADADAKWNAAHRGVKSATISGGDVRYNAVYSCDVLDMVTLVSSDGKNLLDSDSKTLTALEAV